MLIFVPRGGVFPSTTFVCPQLRGDVAVRGRVRDGDGQDVAAGGRARFRGLGELY